MAAAAFALFRPDKLFVDQRVDDRLDADVAAALGAPSTTTATTGPADPSAPATDAPEATTGTTPEPAARLLARGDFTEQGGHRLSGAASVVERREGRLLVLELDSENGPDLQLYVSPRADGSVEGGTKVAPLKGNIGTQTYELPDGVDLGATPHVVVWCERFSTPFGTATLQL